jgi:cytochrome c peroxidase
VLLSKTYFLQRRFISILLLWAGALAGFQASAQSDFMNSRPRVSGKHVYPSQAESVVRLGRVLFFDTGLSRDGTVSCASCHQPDRAFSDGKPVAVGIEGRKGTRNTPSLRGAVYTQAQFWDGRRPRLEEQVLDPFFNQNEHGLNDLTELLSKIRQKEEYTALFSNAFGSPLRQFEATRVAEALSAYVRNLKQIDIPLERYLFGKESSALNPAEQRGLNLFRGRAHCADCHVISGRSAPLTDGKFHSLAVGFDRLIPQLAPLSRKVAKATREEIDRWISSDADVAAMGRFVVTLNPADVGSFKTPSLRNVASTAPYMHDGSIATLEEAVERELYYRGREQGRPMVLSRGEREDLLAFLKGLKEVSVPPGHSAPQVIAD